MQKLQRHYKYNFQDAYANHLMFNYLDLSATLTQIIIKLLSNFQPNKQTRDGCDSDKKWLQPVASQDVPIKSQAQSKKLSRIAVGIVIGKSSELAPKTEITKHPANKIELHKDELKLNKSSFRVMMAAQKQSPSPRQNSFKPSYYDSLNRQLQHQSELKNNSLVYDSPIKDHKRTQSLSKAVFGYEIDRNAFQKQSYLSKILNDRLEPYLNKQKNNTIETGRMAKHQSFTINHPISLQY